MFSLMDSFLIVDGDGFYDLIETAAPRVLAVFVGHGHMWEHDTMLGTINVYETGALGDTNGNPDNVHIVDVDPAGASITVTIGRENGQYWSDMVGGGEN